MFQTKKPVQKLDLTVAFGKTGVVARDARYSWYHRTATSKVLLVFQGSTCLVVVVVLRVRPFSDHGLEMAVFARMIARVGSCRCIWSCVVLCLQISNFPLSTLIYRTGVWI